MNSKPVDWSKWETKNIIRPTERGVCRTCKHGEYWHLEKSTACNYDTNCEVKAVTRYTLEILVPIKSKVSVCPCFEYVPRDNLAYLEWEYNKKNGRSIHK